MTSVYKSVITTTGLFLFCVLLHTAIIAQAEGVSRVRYLCRTDLDCGPILDGVTSLYFDAHESLFVHEDAPKEDTSFFEESIGTDGSIAVSYIYITADPEGYPVYINRRDGYLYYKSVYVIGDDFFIIKEELPDIEWQITNQKKRIGDLNCIGAVGVFGGRTYDVWFTPDIPVSLGPYKLMGLPGLILEARSRDGRVSYEFLSYESRVDNPPAMKRPQLGLVLTWEELKEYIINLLHSEEALSTEFGSATMDDPPPNFTIEKNKFVIIGPYKEERRSKKKNKHRE